MRPFSIRLDDTLAVDQGIVHATSAGEAADDILPHYRHYIGDNMNLYLAMLVSKLMDAWKIFAILAIRSTVASVIREEPHHFAYLHTDGRLEVNLNEQIDTEDVRELLEMGNINPAEWGDTQVGPITAANFAPTKVSAYIANLMRSPTAINWIETCSRMTYSVLAVNGISLVRYLHRFAAPMRKLAFKILNDANALTIVRSFGGTPDEAMNVMFYNALHHLRCTNVAVMANAGIPHFVEGIYPGLRKLLPVAPQAILVISRAVECRAHLEKKGELASLMAFIKGMPKDVTLMELHSKTLRKPLDYNEEFHPANVAKHQVEVDAVNLYCVMLFGLYDAVTYKHRAAYVPGPTGGVRISDLISQNVVYYREAYDVGRQLINYPDTDVNLSVFRAILA